MVLITIIIILLFLSFSLFVISGIMRVNLVLADGLLTCDFIGGIMCFVGTVLEEFLSIIQESRSRISKL